MTAAHHYNPVPDNLDRGACRIRSSVEHQLQRSAGYASVRRVSGESPENTVLMHLPGSFASRDRDQTPSMGSSLSRSDGAAHSVSKDRHQGVSFVRITNPE